MYMWAQHHHASELFLTGCSNPNHERRLSPRDFHSEVRAPNISLNTRGAGHRSLCELSIVAAIGVVLQTGVLVFHAVITYRLGWGKGNYKAAPYSYPITAMGTLLLGAGVYICAFVIDSSTHEETRVLKDGFGKEITNTQIVWIQRKYIPLPRAGLLLHC